jgi:hypothetical protein
MVQISQAILHTRKFAGYPNEEPLERTVLKSNDGTIGAFGRFAVTGSSRDDLLKLCARQLSSIKTDKRYSLMGSTAQII